MPKPGRSGKIEKPKDFFGSMKRLFKDLKKWRFLMCLALILACISAIGSIIAPNVLSKLTDEITEGVEPDLNKIQEITILISRNVNEANLKNVELIDVNIDGVSINAEDQIQFMAVLNSIQDENQYEGNTIDNSKVISAIDNLPKSIYELIKPRINMNNVRNISIVLGIIYIVSFVFSYIQGFSMATVSNNYARKLRTNISEKINKLPLKYFDNHETGDILSRITNDVDTIAMNLNQSLATLITSSTLFFGSIIMMFITNVIMAITAVMASILGFVLMFIILKKSQKYFIRRQKELGELNRTCRRNLFRFKCCKGI